MKTYPATHGLSEPAQRIIADAKELMVATADVAEEKVVDARKRLLAALDRGKETWRAIQDKAVAGARTADETIRDHPYQSIGIAFGIGALVGFLLSRRQ